MRAPACFKGNHSPANTVYTPSPAVARRTIDEPPQCKLRRKPGSERHQTYGDQTARLHAAKVAVEPKNIRGEATMNRNAFIKETKQRLVGRRDALRSALAGDMSMLRAQTEQSVGDEVDAAVATEQAELRSQMAS